MHLMSKRRAPSKRWDYEADRVLNKRPRRLIEKIRYTARFVAFTFWSSVKASARGGGEGGSK